MIVITNDVGSYVLDDAYTIEQDRLDISAFGEVQKTYLPGRWHIRFSTTAPIDRDALISMDMGNGNLTFFKITRIGYTAWSGGASTTDVEAEEV